jgi:hypothetical protein
MTNAMQYHPTSMQIIPQLIIHGPHANRMAAGLVWVGLGFLACEILLFVSSYDTDRIPPNHRRNAVKLIWV